MNTWHVAALVGMVAGCFPESSSSSTPDADVRPCYEQPTTCVDSSGQHWQFVIDSIVFPTRASEAFELGLDLDGDPQGRPDNAIGALLLQAFPDASQAAADESVAAGSPLLLIDVQTTSLNHAEDAGAWVLFGSDPAPEPCAGPSDTECGRHLRGDGQFRVAADTPEASLLPGAMTAGVFYGGPGRISIELPLAEAPVRLNLIGARMEVSVSEAGLMSGKLGGGLSRAEYLDTLLPAAVSQLNATIARDCPDAMPPDCATCLEGTNAETMLALFDDCSEGSATCDCRISVEELTNCTIDGCAPQPDIDLLDENGAFNPRSDRVNDSISLGVGFTAVPASFPAP